MPVTSSSAPGTQALVGPPPSSIAVLAMSSFLLMAAILYYIFFRFTFTYTYDGTLVVRSTNPQQLVVTISQGQNLNGPRTSKWLATVQPLGPGAAAVLTHRFGPKSSEIKNNRLVPK